MAFKHHPPLGTRRTAPALLLCLPMLGAVGIQTIRAEDPYTASSDLLARPGPAADYLGVADDSVWFCPNVASRDMLQLFSSPGLWSSARSNVKVFKFYQGNLEPGCPAGNCGPNTAEALVGVNAFRKLVSSTWGIKIAMESAAIKAGPHCDAVLYAEATRAAIGYVRANGGTVAYVAMDEPWYSASKYCGETQAQAAQYVKRYVDRVRQAPNGSVLVGLIEPIVQNDQRWNRVALQNWIRALLNAGVTLPFFHLDVDFNSGATGADVASMKNFCEARGIVFGVLLPGSGRTNQAYYESVMGMIPSVNTGGVPQHTVFQSFEGGTALARRPFGLQPSYEPLTVPDNLGECDAYTHTRLINDGLGEMYGLQNNAAYLDQAPPPTTMRTGQGCDVWVKMKNTGGPTWSAPDYFLGYTGTYSPWAIAMVEMPSGTCAPRSDTYVFRFRVTAPSQPGTYLFRWRMKTISSGSPAPFGQVSQGVWVTVTR